jgi:hypothetical protein
MGLIDEIKKKFNVQNTLSFFENLEDVQEKTIAEVTIDSVGITVPLPTQQEALDFYVAFEGLKDGEVPTNKLSTLNPKNWTKRQYVQYQVDVKEFKVKTKFKNAKDARTLRKLKLQGKAEEENDKEKLSWVKLFQNQFNENLKANTPDDLKSRGIQKTNDLLYGIIKVLIQYTLPPILQLSKDLAVENFEENKQNLLNGLGVDNIKNVSKEDLLEFCPTEEMLDKIIEQRNGLVDFLNNQQNKINTLTTGVNITGETANFLQNTSNIIKAAGLIATAVANAAPKIFPKIVLSIQTLETFRQTLVQNLDGTSRIKPLASLVSNVNITLNALSTLITQIVLALGQIDEIIDVCRPNATLTNLTPEVLLTVALELSADVSENEFLYKGFRLEIETKPYTDVVNQNRAVGKNQSGIIMISTEYSFASDPNVLINELKFIIDRDGLKAY